jgi:hypothetical protein
MTRWRRRCLTVDRRSIRLGSCREGRRIDGREDRPSVRSGLRARAPPQIHHHCAPLTSVGWCASASGSGRREGCLKALLLTETVRVTGLQAELTGGRRQWRAQQAVHDPGKISVRSGMR